MLPGLIGIVATFAIVAGLAFFLGRTLRLWPRNKVPNELRKYDFATASRDAFNLDILKALCLFGFLMSFVVLVPRAHQLPAPRLAVLVANDTFSRLVSLLRTLLFAAGFYGIHRRLMIAWKAGWAFLVLVCFGMLSALPTILRFSSPDRWVVSVAWVVITVGFAAYSSRWWNRMKYYFVQ